MAYPHGRLCACGLIHSVALVFPAGNPVYLSSLLSPPVSGGSWWVRELRGEGDGEKGLDLCATSRTAELRASSWACAPTFSGRLLRGPMWNLELRIWPVLMAYS